MDDAQLLDCYSYTNVYKNICLSEIMRNTNIFVFNLFFLFGFLYPSIEPK